MSLVRRHRFAQLPVMGPGTKGDLWVRGADPGIAVAVAGPSGYDGYVLSWNDTTKLPEYRVGGGGGSLATLSDANISSPANLDVLQYRTSDNKWHNVATLAAANIPSLDASKITTGQLAQARGGTGKDTSGATDGQILIGKSSDHSLNLATLASSDGSVAITNGGGTINLAVTTVPVSGLPKWLAYAADTPPASTHTEDDEFESSTLAGKWTETLTGSPTRDIDTTLRSHYQMIAAAASSVMLQAYSNVDLKITARLRFPYINTGDILRIVANDSSGTSFTNAMLIGIQGDGGLRLWSRDAGVTNTRGGPTTLGSGFSSIIVSLRRVGNNWDGFFSLDGWTWVHAGPQFAKTFTVAAIGFQITAGAPTTGAAVPIAVDWFRRDWAGAP